MNSSDSSHAHLRDSSSVRLALALWGGLAVADVGRLADAPDLLTLTGLAALIAACSVHADVRTALLSAGLAWLVFNGFVVNQLGTLHVTGPADAVRGVVLAAAALAGTEVAR